MKDLSPHKTYAFAEFQLDSQKRVLLKESRALPLNPKTFDLLLLLIERGGEVLSKDELLEKVWAGQFVEENNLTVQVSALRKILGERKGEHRFIVTVPGKGYKFVANVLTPAGEEKEIVINSHTVSRVSVEHETVSEAGSEKVRSESVSSNESRTSDRLARPSSFILWSSVAAILLIGLSGIWSLQDAERAGHRQPKLTRLTKSGKVTNATITPDGKYAVFAQTEEGGEGLYLRQIATGTQKPILPSQLVKFIGLAVSPDGKFIYCTTFLEDKFESQLWRVPLAGGVIEQIGGVVTGGAVSFSPDGKQIAFTESPSGLKETHLNVAVADGSNKRILIRAPDVLRSFSTSRTNPVAWSPEADEIACAIEETSAGGVKTGIFLVNTSSGKERAISKHRWDYVSHLVWMDAENLALIASRDERGRGQIWTISKTTGQARQLTDDLNSYSWLAASASGDLLTVQRNTVSYLRVADWDEEAKLLHSREIHDESGIISNVAWALDGAILYSSSVTGRSEIWRINSDGSNPIQLTVGADISVGLSVSPVDGSLVFSSVSDGKHSLRLATAKGKNIYQLTDGTEDVWGSFLPDGQHVIFQRGLSGQTSALWRVETTGAALTQLTRRPSWRLAVSPDGTQTACYFTDAEPDGARRIGLISSDTGAIQGKLSLPKLRAGIGMRWHPSGRFLTQIFYTGENANLLLLPVDGGSAITLSGLDKGYVHWFEWARDGKRLVLSQVIATQDVILLSDDKS